MEENMSIVLIPEKIENELRRLQQEASPYGSRATLFNLVVFTRKETQDLAEELYSGMFGKRTARVIRIQRSLNEESSVSVSARCREGESGEAICFQEVLIECGRDELGAQPGAWTPLLIRDIPVFVLWLDKVVGNEDILSAAVGHADKVIFDSDFPLSPPDPVGEMFRIYLDQIADEHVLIADLAWKRGLPVRKLTAWAFNREESLPLAEKISAIHIEGGRKAMVQLYLLWIAERMEWTIDGPGMRSLDGRRIQAEHHNEGPVEDGIEVKMTLTDGQEIILSGAANGCGDIEIPGMDASPRVFQSASDAELLQEETDYLYGDRTYLPSLQQLRHHN